MIGVAFAPRMSDTEGLMWRLERDPRWATTFANLSVLDRPPDVERLRRRLADAAGGPIPRLRQIARETAGSRATPRWVDDPEFDLDVHLRQVALPAPGTERQLLDMAATLTADPLDRTRPLWQFTVLEGLEDGRAALLQKVHHTIADGEGAVLLAMAFHDLERTPPDATSVHAPPATPRSPRAEAAGATVVEDVLAGALRLPLGIAREVRALLAEPERIPEASRAAASTVEEVAEQLGDGERARSPLWQARSTRRRLEVASAPLTAVRDAARTLGGSLNAAFLTVAAEAAGRYHAAAGSPVDHLRTSMPVSTRSDGSGTNAFSLTRFLVPTGPMSIEDRFRAVDQVAREARHASDRMPLASMAAVAATMPTALLTRVAELQARTVDFATSNVRGSPVPLYVAGARVVRNHPIGPTGGVAFNLTLLSYDDRLDLGLHCDRAAVERPDLLRDELMRAIERLVACA